MSWTDKILSIFKSEAKDVKSGLDSLKGKFDAELTERENRMAATPTEKMDMLQGDIASNEDRFDQLADDVRAKHGVADAEAEVAARDRGEPLADRLDRTLDRTSDSDSATAQESSVKGSEAGADPAAATTVDQAISDAMADAGPDPEAAEAARQEATRERRAAAAAAADAKFAAQKERAEDTLDELRAELGLED